MQAHHCVRFVVKKNQVLLNTIFVVVCAIFLNKASFAEPANLQLLMKEVQVYHDSGAYQNELEHVIIRANQFMIQRTEANARSAHPKKIAVVLDIDETSLSNYHNMVARHFVGERQQIHQEMLAANGQVIAPMLKFYNDALKHHVTIFFVTGRHESERAATIKNLKNAGYHDWSGLYLRPDNYHHHSIIPFKTQTRATISKKGYTIIATIGDQYSDLIGGYAERTFKLPNPYYHLH